MFELFSIILIIFSVVIWSQLSKIQKDQVYYLKKIAEKINALKEAQDELKAQISEYQSPTTDSSLHAQTQNTTFVDSQANEIKSELAENQSNEIEASQTDVSQIQLNQLETDLIQEEQLQDPQLKPEHLDVDSKEAVQYQVVNEEQSTIEAVPNSGAISKDEGIEHPETTAQKDEVEQQPKLEQAEETDQKQKNTKRENIPEYLPEFYKGNQNNKTGAEQKANSKASESAQSGFDISPFGQKLLKLFQEHWMLWVGGLALALGGIFLVKYGLERGMLPPIVRVSIGGLFGCSLIAVALLLHKKNIVFEGFPNYTPAALAGGGVVTCFSLTLLAYLNYHLLPTSVAAILLTGISALSAFMAIILGPVLAVLGFAGAYAVPLLIKSDVQNLLALTVYIGVVSIGASYVAQRVKRQWLWMGIWGAHAFWLYAISFIWGAQLTSSPWPGLFALLSIVGFVLIPRLGIQFKTVETKYFALPQLITPKTPHILLAVFAFPIAVFAAKTGGIWLILGIVLIAMMLFAAVKNSQWDLWPVAALIMALNFTMFAILNQFVVWNVQFLPQGNYELSFLFIALFTLYSVVFGAKFPSRVMYHGLAGSSSFLFIVLLYLITPGEISFDTYLLWSFVLIVVASTLFYRVLSATDHWQRFCYWLGINANVTLTLTLLLDGNTLTLALLAQVLSLAFLLKKIPVNLPDKLIQVFLAAILLRLSTFPWLPEYFDSTMLGIHWSIILYPFAAGIFWLSSRTFQSEQLKLWCQGAMLHCVALLVTTETSYQLVGHYPFAGGISFHWKESALMAMNWGILSCVYFYRMESAGQFKKLYQYAATIMATGGGILFASNFIFYNPVLPIMPINIGSTPIFNWLAVLWLVPALVCFYLERFILQVTPNWKLPLKWFSLALGFLYINAVNRQIWQGQDISIFNPTSDGELYTYSLLWLIIAVSTIVFGFFKHNIKVQKIGLSLLIVTVIKVFLIDMASLTGLLKAVSFIGLGLSLVALSWLFQKLRQLTQEVKPEINSEDTE